MMPNVMAPCCGPSLVVGGSWNTSSRIWRTGLAAHDPGNFAFREVDVRWPCPGADATPHHLLVELAGECRTVGHLQGDRVVQEEDVDVVGPERPQAAVETAAHRVGSVHVRLVQQASGQSGRRTPSRAFDRRARPGEPPEQFPGGALHVSGGTSEGTRFDPELGGDRDVVPQASQECAQFGLRARPNPYIGATSK